MGAMCPIRGLLAGAVVLLATVESVRGVDAKHFILRDRKAFLMELKLDRRELATVKAALARRTGGGNALVVGDDLPQAASIL